MASLRISFEGIKSTGYGKFILLSAITAPLSVAATALLSLAIDGVFVFDSIPPNSVAEAAENGVTWARALSALALAPPHRKSSVSPLGVRPCGLENQCLVGEAGIGRSHCGTFPFDPLSGREAICCFSRLLPDVLHDGQLPEQGCWFLGIRLAPLLHQRHQPWPDFHWLEPRNPDAGRSDGIATVFGSPRNRWDSPQEPSIRGIRVWADVTCGNRQPSGCDEGTISQRRRDASQVDQGHRRPSPGDHRQRGQGVGDGRGKDRAGNPGKAIRR